MRRLLYLAVFLILAPMPVKAQQQATRALTITVGSSSSGGNQATQALTITVGPPQASQGFTMTVLHSITLTWQAVTPGAGQFPIIGYNVFRSTMSGQPYSQVNTTPISGLQYIDGGLTSGSTYYYVITSVDSKGNQSPASSQMSATVPVP
jgi:hypothetical protein